jgi:pyrrolysine biosynthesis protein PylC
MSFFRQARIPTPKPWPDSGFPVIVKPSNRSGSESIYRADNRRQLENALILVRRLDETPIVQEFVVGPALSLEVISAQGLGQPLQVTGIEFDELYGCKRVYAPVEINSKVEDRMREIGIEISSKLKLNGLMDVQAILARSEPQVNEINARLPSQTPSVVYHSTKINMVELLTELFVEGKRPHIRIQSRKAVRYEHVTIVGKELRVQGEHVIAHATGLRLIKGFLGAEEAITNLKDGTKPTNPVATLIVKAQNFETASEKMKGVVENIMTEYHLHNYTDPSPERGKNH